MILVPLLAVGIWLSAVVEYLQKAGVPNSEMLSSSIFGMAYSLGETLGPLAGGGGTQLVGFEWACTIMAAMFASYAATYAFQKGWH